MYYKLEPGNETYEKLKDTVEKCKAIDAEAKEVAKELGFSAHGKQLGVMAGGISCMESAEKPEGYKTVGKAWQNLIYPKASQKEALEKINALPVMTYDEFNDSIGFRMQFIGLTQYKSFGVMKLDGMFIIEVADACTYNPAEGMVEILASEYKSLKDSIPQSVEAP